VTVGPSGGGFSVLVAELVQFSSRARALSQDVQEVGATGAGSACIVTGAPALDGQLSRYQAGWTRQLQAVAGAEGDFAGALLNAAAGYVSTDTSVMPPSGGGSGGGPGSGPR
jgi:hypothetical protein